MIRGRHRVVRVGLGILVAILLVALGYAIHPSDAAIRAAARPTGPSAATAAADITKQMEGSYLLSPVERAALITPLVVPSIRSAVINQYDRIAPELTQTFGLPANVDASKQAYITVAILGTRTIWQNPTAADVRVWSSTYAGTNDCGKAVEVWSVNEDQLALVNGVWRLSAAKDRVTQLATSSTACMATIRSNFEGP